MQLFATVLSDVCYRLHGIVVGRGSASGTNARHYLKDLFDRRLRQGRCFRTPCLGWSEFTASYWGPFRSERGGQPASTEVDQGLNLRIPSLLRSVFEHSISSPEEGRYNPRFDNDVEVKAGVLLFDFAEIRDAG
jgi:CRISPR-associated protein Cas5d